MYGKRNVHRCSCEAAKILEGHYWLYRHSTLLCSLLSSSRSTPPAPAASERTPPPPKIHRGYIRILVSRPVDERPSSVNWHAVGLVWYDVCVGTYANTVSIHPTCMEPRLRGARPVFPPAADELSTSLARKDSVPGYHMSSSQQSSTRKQRCMRRILTSPRSSRFDMSHSPGSSQGYSPCRPLRRFPEYLPAWKHRAVRCAIFGLRPAPYVHIPGYPSKVRGVACIAQVNPAADSRSTGAPLGTGTTGAGSTAALVPRLDEAKPPWRSKSQRLALQVWVVGGVPSQHLVEYGQEPVVFLKGVGRGRDNSGCANRERQPRRRRFKIREHIGIWLLRMREDFLQHKRGSAESGARRMLASNPRYSGWRATRTVLARWPGPS